MLLLSLLIVIAFHIRLWSAGLEIMDFWREGSLWFHPLPAEAKPFLSFARIAALTAYPCAGVGFVALLTASLTISSRLYKTALWFALIAFLAGVAGLLAFRVGLILAGV